MSMQDKILMRKIKKREKQKLKFLQNKENKKKEEIAKQEDINEKGENGTKRLIANDDDGPSTKKKKTKKTELGSEENGEINENELEDSTEENNKVNGGSKSTLEMTSNITFESLKDKISENTLKAIAEMGFKNLTEIQAKTIEPLLELKNLVGAAKTGSGKTLAFLIPVVELVYKVGFKPRNGTGAIIISPTRELCMQTFGVLKELMKYHHQTYGLIMGGASREAEAQKLWKGVNILVATPGRLLDHLQNTPDFVYKCTMCLVIDEADRILEIGFEQEMRAILSLLPTYRQTMLFSATQNKNTDTLKALAFKEEPIYVGVDDIKAESTVSTLRQGYVVCPTEKRLHALFTFLKKKKNNKVMVFFSSCASVEFHQKLFNYIDLPVMAIHGKQKQAKRTTTTFQFCNVEKGVLLCTDVMARGLDIPAVDWIVQYDPPSDPKEYIHRVGRTARGEGSSGHAMLMLRQEELDFLWYLQKAKVPLNEFSFKDNTIANIQEDMENLIGRNYYLKMLAKEAYKGYIRAYNSHRFKTVFNINTLDSSKVALSFGLRVPPPIDFNASAKEAKRPMKKNKGGGGFNSYRNTNQNDNRNFKKHENYGHAKRKSQNDYK